MSNRGGWIAFVALVLLVGLLPSVPTAPALPGEAVIHAGAVPAKARDTDPARTYLPLIARPEYPWQAEVGFEFSQVLQPGEDSRYLAVAFHSIQFIDAQAEVLGTLTFGTPEANRSQGDGWYGNEDWPGIGPFQWAGGPSKRASLAVTMPPGTKGMLLHINSIADGLWMEVTVDGATGASVRVDTYWHLGYVPVRPLVPVPPSAQAPEWTTGRYFPRFPVAARLYAIRVRSALEDWWSEASSPAWRINSSHDTMMALTLVCMQGVINRSGPAVFLDWEDRGAYRHPSRHWLGLLRDHVEVVDLDLDGLSAFRFLYRRFASHFQGAVVYDPDVPDTINVANMLAGLEDRVVLAPEQLSLPGMPSFSSVTDLRTLARNQGWDTTDAGKYRLYQWVYDNLWPRLEHRVIGMISPGPPTSEPIAGTVGQWYPLGIASRDYITALRLSALWLDPIEEPQAGLFDRFLQDAPSPIPVFGNYGNDEEGTTALDSRHGDWNAAITIGNSPIAVGNLTVLSGVRPPLVRYAAQIDPERILATLGDRPLLTLWSSDGDSMIYQTDRGFHGGVDFYWEKVRDYRFGWTTNPTLADVAPIVWNDYLESGSEASLISGLSGCGYMYPPLMSDGQLRAYLARAALYLSETGLRVLHMSNRFGSLLNAVDDRVAELYYQGLRSAGYLGAFVGLSGWPWGVGFHYPGVPVPAVAPSYVLRTNNAAAIMDDLLARRPGEYFVDLTASHLWQGNQTGYGWHRGTVVADADAHAGKALRFSRDDQHPPGLVVWGPYSALAPGDYAVRFRLKVEDSRETEPVAQIYVGVREDQWRFITQRYVSPADFSRAGEYQQFDISFRLDRFTTGIEFRVDYYGGKQGGWASTDLFADYIVAEREGGLDLPVMAGAFIALVGPVQPLDESLEITREFERRGGLVLQPDEFMAALNPEYMIDFATPRLGAGHASLAAARQHLDAGDYLASLLTVRAALRAAYEPGKLLNVRAAPAALSIR